MLILSIFFCIENRVSTFREKRIQSIPEGLGIYIYIPISMILSQWYQKKGGVCRNT
jgi:hypothetical protein